MTCPAGRPDSGAVRNGLRTYNICKHCPGSYNDAYVDHDDDNDDDGLEAGSSLMLILMDEESYKRLSWPTNLCPPDQPHRRRINWIGAAKMNA